jgi:hypothetical protein
MKVFYSDQNIYFTDVDFENSLFLAGPTPRSSNVISWRIQALKLLEELGYKGNVSVPERTNWSIQFDYCDQADWEEFALDRCKTIIFWVPRQFPDMKALTTNVEFGIYITKSPDKIVYGRPDNAEQIRYLDYKYSKITGNVPCKDLISTLKKATT